MMSSIFDEIRYEDDNEEDLINYEELLASLLQTQKMIEECKDQNDIEELNRLFDKTKQNLGSYKSVMTNVRKSLYSISHKVAKCERFNA